MTQIPRAILASAILLLCLAIQAQCSPEYIVAVSRLGSIQFIDPATLKTLSTITVDLSSGSTGIAGVFANPDERTIYVEGPIGANAMGANNCCWLYSLDLATLQTKAAAGIWGSRSRGAFISAGPGLMQPVSIPTKTAAEETGNHHWQSSPDGRWQVALRDGPNLDLFNEATGEITRSLKAPDADEPWHASGTWLGNQFYVYANSQDSGRLWSMSPESAQFDSGIPMPELNPIPECKSDALTVVTAAGDRLVLYENFGGKLDRRSDCGDVPGGAWIIDPATGRLAAQVSSDLHFWMLVPNRTGSELYGVTSGLYGTEIPGELVRVDGRSGKVLQSRTLDTDYWWITITPLRVVPSRDRSLTLAADKSW